MPWQKIDKSNLLSYFAGKFGLTKVATLGLDTTIQPVLTMDNLLFTQSVEQGTYALTSTATAAWFATHTVPSGKRWRVERVEFSCTGGAQTTKVGIKNNAGVDLALDSFTAAATYYKEFTTPVVMEQGWQFEFYASDNQGAQTMTMKLFVKVEDV